MGVVRLEGPDSPSVNSVEELLGRFQTLLLAALPDWKQRLRQEPGSLPELETAVRAVFDQGCDLVIAGLLAWVMRPPEFEQASEGTRRDHRQPLGQGRLRTIQVRLLGGLVIWISSLDCAPRKSSRSSESVLGLYVELAQFGFGKGCSPGLESRVARQAALCPSLAFARQELARDGVNLDVKAVRRITDQCGAGLLRLRRHELAEWRAGRLPAGTELRGKRVAVQIDGGRTKLRGALTPAATTPEATDDDGLPTTNVPGRSRRRAKRTLTAEWREPKQVIIFTHDERGRMEKDSLATIDATFLGPDALAELVAMPLHRLGASQAASLTFGGDGAVWIGDRLPAIVRLAKLEHVPRYEVLDCCHAAHHISLALATFGRSDAERLPLYREQRTPLRNGQWQRVVNDLADLAASSPQNEKLHTQIAYLRKHGAAGRLKYPTFRGLGLPLGSGAIESSIRRVINLRWKGNGIFWRDEHAEEMLPVRSQVITNRWDARLASLRQHRRVDGRSNWHWSPRAMTGNPEPAAHNATKT